MRRVVWPFLSARYDYVRNRTNFRKIGRGLGIPNSSFGAAFKAIRGFWSRGLSLSQGLTAKSTPTLAIGPPWEMMREIGDPESE